MISESHVFFVITKEYIEKQLSSCYQFAQVAFGLTNSCNDTQIMVLIGVSIKQRDPTCMDPILDTESLMSLMHKAS